MRKVIFYKKLLRWYFLYERLNFNIRIEYRLRIWRILPRPRKPRKVRKDKGIPKKRVTAEMTNNG